MTSMLTFVVVGTNPERENFLDHFLDGIPGYARDYLYVANTWGMELGHIAEAYTMGFPKFAFLQDSMKVHDWAKFMNDINSVETGYILPRPSCYSMIYRHDVLNEIFLPHVGQDKELSIAMETLFCDEYENVAKKQGFAVPTLYPEMTDRDALSSDRFYEELGEKRLHLRSKCGTLSKFKATYR